MVLNLGTDSILIVALIVNNFIPGLEKIFFNNIFKKHKKEGKIDAPGAIQVCTYFTKSYMP